MRFNHILCTLSALSILVVPTLSLANETPEITISKQGDLLLSCGKLSQEAVLMRDTIFSMEDVKNTSKLRKHGVTALGAIGSLALGTATGGIGLAAAGFLMEQNLEGDKEDADALQDKAEQRRTFVMGIYNAKGCYGPVEHAMQNPEKLDMLQNIASLEPASGQTYQTELRSRYND